MDPDAPALPGPLARYLLLAVTVLGTMSNNIINVPLHAIADDFGQPTSSAVLSVSAFILVLAVAMPITGWFGDRFGPKRVLLLALLLMVVGQLAAAMAPSLGFLIGTRAVQGLACSAIPPMVMGMLVAFFPGQRLRMMGAWAAANGVGQAVGPPVGGLISDLLGWRSVFVIMAVASMAVLAGLARTVPRIEGRPSRLHLVGALLLSSGAASLLLALTALSLASVTAWMSVVVAVIGVVLLGAFLLVSRNNPGAMIPPHLIIESRFMRSSLAAFAQMFTLGTVLVAMPLYLTGPLGLSLSQAGMLFFVLPLTMALVAPTVSGLSGRLSPRLVLRSGLMIIIGGGLATGLIIGSSVDPQVLWPVSVLMVTLGVGMALVQTPAAAGATRSPAGSRARPSGCSTCSASPVPPPARPGWHSSSRGATCCCSSRVAHSSRRWGWR